MPTYRVIEDSLPALANMALLWNTATGEAWEAPPSLASGEQLEIDSGRWSQKKFQLSGLQQLELAARNLKIVNDAPALIGKQKAFDKHPIPGVI